MLTQRPVRWGSVITYSRASFAMYTCMPACSYPVCFSPPHFCAVSALDQTIHAQYYTLMHAIALLDGVMYILDDWWENEMIGANPASAFSPASYTRHDLHISAEVCICSVCMSKCNPYAPTLVQSILSFQCMYPPSDRIMWL